MFPVSKPLYEWIAPLQLIQKPTRFAVIFSVAALPIVAFAVARLGKFRLKLSEKLCYLLCCCMLALIVGSIARVWQAYGKRSWYPEFRQDMDNRGDYLRRAYLSWSDRGIATDPWRLARLARSAARPQIEKGSGSVSIDVWKPRDIRLTTSCQPSCSLVVGQFYYPGWRAAWSRTGENLPLYPQAHSGLMQLDIPGGAGTVQLDLPQTFLERSGLWISCFALLMVASVTAWPVLAGRQASKALPLEPTLMQGRRIAAPVLVRNDGE